MADDGEGKSEAADSSSGGSVTSEEPDLGFGVVGMLVNVSVLLLVVAVCYGIYRRWGKRVGLIAAQGKEASTLPKMKRRDFSLEQLREYDGVQNPRILMAVNMKVFDVTSGKRFYGQGKQTAVVSSPQTFAPTAGQRIFICT
ncbi:PGRC2 protein, partial [Polyodon spathula]|nr:PGRC2 protein [Polyodon spathula]